MKTECHSSSHALRGAFQEESGFSLIITLMMLLLLATLALGLLSLSTITLRQCASGTAMAAARNNARLALMLALGELQKQAGSDQRVTATADMGGTLEGETLANGTPPQNNSSLIGLPKGLSLIQSGTRYWTGVWKNSTTINPELEAYTKTPSPSLLRWLISGNEGVVNPDLLITPASPVAAVGSNGQVSDPKNHNIVYELAYQNEGEWKMRENSIVRVPEEEQVQMIVLKSDAEFFRPSNGTRSGFLQTVVLGRRSVE
ncbi:hypothetical protein KBB96_03325 [Luteolibacter ambystomatis]|uniref:Uncharacterized protein n=1 Tax=Luteolibacter ambystomatis TaxID=2824561 RepID=A0A975PG18_9BACT|nr:hypothetical protein [Luteolibacter ambystomatis]QUE51926.1 hypothetical protein KBB96_03325 [Luteolibacter ambystomatis]